MRYLMQNQLDMSTLLSTTDLPGFDGIDVPNRKRDAWNFDEASSYLKYSLCQIELDRQTALANRFDREGKISKDDISEVWGPLRKLTNNLLPHMEFDKIDVTNRDQVQCFFRVHSKGITVDIDDLSSGEKAVVYEDPAPAGVMYLPVSMIENLLVDPQVIWDAIVTVRHKVNVENVDAVAASLDDILEDLIEHETNRRVKSVFDPQFFRLRDPVDQAQKQIDEHVATLKINYSKDKIDSAVASANEKVSALKAGESRREFFDGKLVLNEFYKKHLHETGMAKEIFVYECARQASTRKSVGKFVEELFAAIGVPTPTKG